MKTPQKLILAFALGLAGACEPAQARTPAIVDFALRQIWPEVRLEMDSFIWEGASAVALHDVELVERSSGNVLATVDLARIRWSYGDLLQRKIDEISMDNLTVQIHAGLLESLPGKKDKAAAEEADASEGGGWSIGRLRCRYGELTLDDPKLAPLALRTMFTFDWQDFGTSPDLREKSHRLVLWNVLAGKNPGGMPIVASLDLVEAELSPSGLLTTRRVQSITASGGKILAGRELGEILQNHGARDKSAAQSPVVVQPADQSKSPPWMLDKFEIENVRVELSGDFPGVGPGFAFTLDTSLANVPLGALTSELGTDVQEIELAQIEILSPVDPLVRVLTIHSVFVYFTLQGIMESHLQRVVLLSPTIYLSQDLFLYMQNMRRGETEENSGTQEPESGITIEAPGWLIEHLRVEFGRLVLGGERIGQVGLPLSFQTSATNVQFDDLASLRLDAILQVEPRSFSFPALQLDLERLRGELRFAYPPERAPDNLVNELYLDGLRWRQFEGTDLWLAATFDSTGVFASFGGEAYGGYMNAGLSFFFGGDSRWLGWVTGTNVDLAQLTAVLAPKNVTMTGRADLRVEVDASGSKIDRVRGDIIADKPGELTIRKLDEFIDDLPPEWSELKRSGATIALETLRDFQYDRVNAYFWFVDEQGRFTLKLPGPQGSRNLSLFLHADSTADGRWKLGDPGTPIQ